MKSISFYPGPSQLYAQVRGYLLDAFDSGLLSMNHRSSAFTELFANCTQALREKLDIPPEYAVLFASSATECWEILAQSLGGGGSLHLANGAFGQKWYEATQRLTGAARLLAFGLNEAVDSLPHLGALLPKSGLLCCTPCETSNGTQIGAEQLAYLRHIAPHALLAADATACMGGAALPWPLLDIGFASVQKCFGLPAGMAVLVCSPRAAQAAKQQREPLHYNSLAAMLQQAEACQTTHTPNVLGIYLLHRVMAHVPPIAQVSAQLAARAARCYAFLEAQGYRLLVQNAAVRAQTVLAVQMPEPQLSDIKRQAQARGLVLGNGYGPWKADTFRIANFPAIEADDMEKLMDFLSNFQQNEKIN